MKQFCITPVMGKRLIGKGMAQHPHIQAALEKGTLVIIAGTTNGYVAEEILTALGQVEGYTRVGFRRGVTVGPGGKLASAAFPGDVVIVDGMWQKGKTIFDAVGDLDAGDIVLKGANALDPYGQAAVQIAATDGGTVHAALSAVYGRRVRLIIPAGLEKRVFDDVVELAKLVNASDASGPRLYPIHGEIFTELDAIELLTGAYAQLIAAGGIYGAEGSGWVAVTGSDEQEDAAAALIRSVRDEPPCEV
ncbi:MAG: hypothetical protein MUF84_06690 [Anaerolineae bacterium]|jgi:hypothetical protein|nr:hypothetical protein [Anaerolineae bacterium]